MEDNPNNLNSLIAGLSLEQKFQLKVFKDGWERLPREELLVHLEMLFVQLMARQNLYVEMMKQDKFRGL